METTDLGSGLTVEIVSTGTGKYHITSHVQTLRVALGTVPGAQTASSSIRCPRHMIPTLVFLGHRRRGVSVPSFL